jgi:methionine-S-sulfoxide reductase
LTAATLSIACSADRRSTPTSGPAPDTVLVAAAEAPEGRAIAYFAGGCFWGVEHFMEALEGVDSVESGYMGGTVENPTYEQVVRHETGHFEAVRVNYDPAKVSYERLAREFFEIHDPTQADGQGPDIGQQYLSVVFVNDEAERKTVESLIAILQGEGFDVATTIQPASAFWIAEGYHQDYYARSGKTPYCHAKVPRFPK